LQTLRPEDVVALTAAELRQRRAHDDGVNRDHAVGMHIDHGEPSSTYGDLAACRLALTPSRP
jgi:hypothetical protein